MSYGQPSMQVVIYNVCYIDIMYLWKYVGHLLIFSAKCVSCSLVWPVWGMFSLNTFLWDIFFFFFFEIELFAMGKLVLLSYCPCHWPPSQRVGYGGHQLCAAGIPLGPVQLLTMNYCSGVVVMCTIFLPYLDLLWMWDGGGNILPAILLLATVWTSWPDPRLSMAPHLFSTS